MCLSERQLSPRRDEEEAYLRHLSQPSSNFLYPLLHRAQAPCEYIHTLILLSPFLILCRVRRDAFLQLMRVPARKLEVTILRPSVRN